MTSNSGTPGRTPTTTRLRTLPWLVGAPVCSVLLVLGLLLLLDPLIPSHIAVHVGPDGVGHGSPRLMVAVACGIAAVIFAIGGATAKEFTNDDHWFQTQKSIVVAIMALGYGVIGTALATIVSTIGADPDEVSVHSVGMGLLGFLFLFIVAACVYVAVLPRAKMETLG